MLKDGLYEQIINKSLDAELATTDKLSKTAPIDSAEASKVLAKYVAEVVEKGLDNLVDNGGDVNAQVALANRIITTIISETKEKEFDEMSVAQRAEQLLALFDKRNNILALDDNYQWSLVGSSSPDYLWILARTPRLPQQTLDHILSIARKRGYDTSKLIFVRQ